MKTFPSTADIALRAAEYESVVCVQGLGFVGAAMAIAVADAVTTNGSHPYLVVGVELDSPVGQGRAAGLMRGNLPFSSTDPRLQGALRSAISRGNFVTTCDPEVYSLANVTIVDVHLDVDFRSRPTTADLTGFREAIRTVADRMPPGGLILVETTVPPGTTLEVALPILRDALDRRGLARDSISLAHSYERVMPGPHHLDSIIDYWRVYSGVDLESAKKCRAFLETVINVDEFPLRELDSPTASETAKVLENTFRAVTIALMDEWGLFAESLGIDLFEVIDAIRMRPTHANMREPGLGVGGYCLTKDPLFPQVALNEFFPSKSVDFPITSLALSVNAQMPTATTARLRSLLDGRLEGRRILVLGASYRPDVDDTRYSPAESLVRELITQGVGVFVHDPLASAWSLSEVEISQDLPSPDGFDAVVFAVAHSFYAEMDVAGWTSGYPGWLLDANHVLTPNQRRSLLEHPDIRLFSVGRGFQ